MRNFYYDYLDSEDWLKAKRKCAKKYGWGCSMLGCPRLASEFHHLSYDHLWTEGDWEYIRPLCHRHHYLAHNSIRGKVPMNYRALSKRYNRLRRAKWRRLRASVIFEWFVREYQV